MSIFALRMTAYSINVQVSAIRHYRSTETKIAIHRILLSAAMEVYDTIPHGKCMQIYNISAQDPRIAKVLLKDTQTLQDQLPDGIIPGRQWWKGRCCCAFISIYETEPCLDFSSQDINMTDLRETVAVTDGLASVPAAHIADIDVDGELLGM